MLVWDKYIGLDNGYTICLCGTKIYQLNFECGHVVPHSKGGGTTAENLRPVCPSCNKSMGNMHFMDFVKSIGINYNLTSNEDCYFGFVIIENKKDSRTGKQEVAVRNTISGSMERILATSNTAIIVAGVEATAAACINIGIKLCKRIFHLGYYMNWRYNNKKN
jgi:hypothetical protein